MLALVIETATERAIVAIVQSGTYLYLAGLPFGFYNSKFLVPKIQEAFQEIRKTPHDLNVIVVGQGPGSYTGIRVGASVAKTFSYSCKIPLIGVGTLESFLPSGDCTFCSILDAKLSGFYVLKGTKSSNNIRFQGEPQICTSVDLEQFLEDVEVLVTPHVSLLREKVDKICPTNLRKWEETAPDGLEMARRAAEKLRQGQYSLDGSLAILYLK